MMFVWLLLRPFIKPVAIGVALLLVGQAAGLPIAESILTNLIEISTYLIGAAWDAILTFLTEQVADRLNPFSIAFGLPQTAG